MDRSEYKIAIIGAGHMGSAIIEGFINAGIDPKNIIAANPSPAKLNRLKNKYGIKTAGSNIDAVRFARFIFLTVKPTLVSPVLQEIAFGLDKKILLSAAALTPINLITKHVPNREVTVVRIMPNLPVAVNLGIIGVYPKLKKSDHILNDVNRLLSLLGLVVPLSKESDLDSITLLTGCGPAIIAYFMEILEKTGKSILNDVNINSTIYNLCAGTLKYMSSHQISASELKQKVATKGGVTEGLLRSLDLGEVPKLIEKTYKVNLTELRSKHPQQNMKHKPAKKTKNNRRQ